MPPCMYALPFVCRMTGLSARSRPRFPRGRNTLGCGHAGWVLFYFCHPQATVQIATLLLQVQYEGFHCHSLSGTRHRLLRYQKLEPDGAGLC